MPETVPKIKIFSTMVGVTLDQIMPPLAPPNVPADIGMDVELVS